MRSELVVDVTPRDMTTALLEDGRLVSLQRETRDVSYAVGNIYLAKVKKLMPGLNAAFVNVGYSKDAFLHYLDLGSQFNTFSQYIKTVRDNPNKRPNSISKVKCQPDTNKHGTVSDVLTQGQELLVQIAKDRG
jgi:ribonuclease G